MSRPPPPKRSKQATLFDLFHGASTSREHDADHDSQSVTEAADDQTNGDSESLSSSVSVISNALPRTEQAAANTQLSQCSSTCCAIGDSMPFQPIAAATIGRTHRQQGQKSRLFCPIYMIPVTTATAERSFSALRRLKTYSRSTMSKERLNHTMLLYPRRD